MLGEFGIESKRERERKRQRKKVEKKKLTFLFRKPKKKSGEAFSRKKKLINAVYVTGECTTTVYLGKDPAMLSATALMRQGAAAVWLSTQSSFTLGGGGKGRGRKSSSSSSLSSAASLPSSAPKRRIRAKYELQHFVKVHHGSDDVAYKSMGTRGDKEWLKSGEARGGEQPAAGGDSDKNNKNDEDENSEERVGIYFTRDVPRVASKAIDGVLRKIAPRLLSPSQLLREGLRIAREKKERKKDEKKRGVPSPSPSSPPASSRNRFSFADCCEHFALHPGIFSMLIAFMKGMRLPVSKALPSFASLRDYSNLSAASTWYVLGYLESVGDDSFGGIRKGERILQLGVGSGVKAGELVGWLSWSFFSSSSEKRLRSFRNERERERERERNKKNSHSFLFFPRSNPLQKNKNDPGVCVWRALRDIRGVDHEAWRHLDGKRVLEEELPLPVPDVLLSSEEKKGSKKNSNDDAADAELLAAATAVLASATGSTTAADDEVTKGNRKSRRVPPPEVRASALERVEEQGKEWDAAHERLQQQKKQLQQQTQTQAQALGAQEKEQEEASLPLEEEKAPLVLVPAVAPVAPATPAH